MPGLVCTALGNGLSVYIWLAAGRVAFLALEQILHWHHCHRPVAAHRPPGHLILVADGLHNLVGGLAAYALAGHLDVAVLIPFAAGNFLYIALADLVPELTTSPVAHDKIVHTAGFATGLALLLAVALIS